MIKKLDAELAKALFAHFVFDPIKIHYDFHDGSYSPYSTLIMIPVKQIKSKKRFREIVNNARNLVNTAFVPTLRPKEQPRSELTERVYETIIYWINAGLFVDQKIRVIPNWRKSCNILPKWFILSDPEKYSDEELIEINLALFLIRNLLRIRYGVIRKISLIDVFIFEDYNKDFLVSKDVTIKCTPKYKNWLTIEPEAYVLFSTIIHCPYANYATAFEFEINNLTLFLPLIGFGRLKKINDYLRYEDNDILSAVLCLVFGNYLLHIGRVNIEIDKDERLKIPDKFAYDPAKIRLYKLVDGKKLLSLFRHLCWIIDNLTPDFAIQLRQKLSSLPQESQKRECSILYYVSAIYDLLFNTNIAPIFLPWQKD